MRANQRLSGEALVMAQMRRRLDKSAEDVTDTMFIVVWCGAVVLAVAALLPW